MSEKRKLPESNEIGPAPYPAIFLGRQETSKKQKLESSRRTTDNLSINIRDPINKIIRDSTMKNEGYVQGPLDPVFGQRRAFPISIDLNSIDPNKQPEDVNEYLALVRLEAQEFDVNNKEYESEDDDYDEGCYYYLSDKDTQDEAQVSRTEEQVYLDYYKSEREKYDNFRKHLTELDAVDLPITQKEWKTFIFSNSPTDELTAQIIEEDQHVKLIVYFTKWLNTNVDENFERWMFKMLGAIDDLLDNSFISVLRSLGKKANKQSGNDLDERNSDIMKKLLFIIGGFYGQRDLII